LLISEIHSQPFIATEQSGLLQKIGERHVCSSIDQALILSREYLDVGFDTKSKIIQED